MRFFALAITKILNPSFAGVATMFAAVAVQQITFNQKLLWFGLGILASAIPALILLFEASKGKISSFWSPEGEERVRSFWGWIASAGLYAALALYLQAPRLIIALATSLLILGLVDLAVASMMKLSIHSEMITFFVLTVVLAVSVTLVYLSLLILLVGWSRVYLKAHSISEVSLGTLATIVVVYLVFSYFSLATF